MGIQWLNVVWLYQPSFTQLDFADLISASAKPYEQLYFTLQLMVSAAQMADCVLQTAQLQTQGE